jgi:hypothetical protein
MAISDLIKNMPPPVVIGGVGGSGTRLIAQILRDSGYFMGNDLNDANDYLLFPLLFKRIEILSSSEEEFDELIEILFKGVTGCGDFTQKQIDLINNLASQDREQCPAWWLKQRADFVLSSKHALKPFAKWGWKAPNSHIILDRLIPRFRNMKYIHVARNGLDMAYSDNQNQLKLWGRSFIGENLEVSPYYSLKYWRIAHRRVLDLAKLIGADFLFLNYDDFCLNPDTGIRRLLEFLGLEATPEQSHKLTGLVHPPKSIGRFRQYGINNFDKADVAFVKQLGFATEV